jgi:hypothetical protein
VRMDRCPVVVAEHAVVVPEGCCDRCEDRDRAPVEIDGSSCGSGLAPRFFEFVADGDERAVDGQALFTDVDLTTA